MTKAEKFKEQLARVFDSDLRTKQWENYADYAIIGLIVISTIEVFLSTYDGIVEKYGKFLHFIDYFTTICFTINNHDFGIVYIGSEWYCTKLSICVC